MICKSCNKLVDGKLEKCPFCGSFLHETNKKEVSKEEKIAKGLFGVEAAAIGAAMAATKVDAKENQVNNNSNVSNFNSQNITSNHTSETNQSQNVQVSDDGNYISSSSPVYYSENSGSADIDSSSISSTNSGDYVDLNSEYNFNNSDNYEIVNSYLSDNVDGGVTYINDYLNENGMTIEDLMKLLNGESGNDLQESMRKAVEDYVNELVVSGELGDLSKDDINALVEAILNGETASYTPVLDRNVIEEKISELLSEQFSKALKKEVKVDFKLVEDVLDLKDIKIKEKDGKKIYVDKDGKEYNSLEALVLEHPEIIDCQKVLESQSDYKPDVKDDASYSNSGGGGRIDIDPFYLGSALVALGGPSIVGKGTDTGWDYLTKKTSKLTSAFEAIPQGRNTNVTRNINYRALPASTKSFSSICESILGGAGSFGGGNDELSAFMEQLHTQLTDLKSKIEGLDSKDIFNTEDEEALKKERAAFDYVFNLTAGSYASGFGDMYDMSDEEIALWMDDFDEEAQKHKELAVKRLEEKCSKEFENDELRKSIMDSLATTEFVDKWRDKYGHLPEAPKEGEEPSEAYLQYEKELSEYIKNRNGNYKSTDNGDDQYHLDLATYFENKLNYYQSIEDQNESIKVYHEQSATIELASNKAELSLNLVDLQNEINDLEDKLASDKLTDEERSKLTLQLENKQLELKRLELIKSLNSDDLTYAEKNEYKRRLASINLQLGIVDTSLLTDNQKRLLEEYCGSVVADATLQDYIDNYDHYFVSLDDRNLTDYQKDALSNYVALSEKARWTDLTEEEQKAYEEARKIYQGREYLRQAEYRRTLDSIINDPSVYEEYSNKTRTREEEKLFEEATKVLNARDELAKYQDLYDKVMSNTSTAEEWKEWNRLQGNLDSIIANSNTSLLEPYEQILYNYINIERTVDRYLSSNEEYKKILESLPEAERQSYIAGQNLTWWATNDNPELSYKETEEIAAAKLNEYNNLKDREEIADELRQRNQYLLNLARQNLIAYNIASNLGIYENFEDELNNNLEFFELQASNYEYLENYYQKLVERATADYKALSKEYDDKHKEYWRNIPTYGTDLDYEYALAEMKKIEEGPLAPLNEQVQAQNEYLMMLSSMVGVYQAYKELTWLKMPDKNQYRTETIVATHTEESNYGGTDAAGLTYTDVTFKFFDKDGNRITDADEIACYCVQNGIIFKKDELTGIVNGYPSEAVENLLAINGYKYTPEYNENGEIINNNYNVYDFTTENALSSYYYLMSKYGSDKGNESFDFYFDLGAKITGYTIADERIKRIREACYSNQDRESNFLDDVRAFNMIVAQSLEDGLLGWAENLDNLFNADGRKSSTDYRNQQYIQHLALDEDFRNKYFNNVYEIGSSIGNMLPSIALNILVSALTGGFGAAWGWSNLASEVLKFSTTFAGMGLSAWGGAKEQGMQMGMSELDASVYGFLSGLSETSLELILGSLPGIGQMEEIGNKIGGFSGFLTKMLSEGIEESTQEVVDAFFISAFTGQPLEVDWDAVLKSGIYGAITSGIMSIGGGIINTGKNGLLLSIDGINHQLTGSPSYINFLATKYEGLNLIELMTSNELKSDLQLYEQNSQQLNDIKNKLSVNPEIIDAFNSKNNGDVSFEDFVEKLAIEEFRSSQMTQEMQELLGDRAELFKNQNELLKQYNDLKAKLGLSEDQVSDMLKANKHRSAFSAEAELISLHEKISNNNKLIDSLNTKIYEAYKVTKQELIEKQNYLDENENSLDTDEYVKLIGEINGLDEKLNSYEALIEGLYIPTENTDTIKDRIMYNENSLLEKANTLTKTEEMLESLQEELEEKLKNGDNSQEVDEIHRKINSLNALKDTLQRKIKNIDQRLMDSFDVQERVVNRTINDINAENKVLNILNENRLNEIDALKDEIKSLQEKLKQEKLKTEIDFTKISDIQNQIKQKTDSLSHLEQEVSNTQEMINNNNSELERITNGQITSINNNGDPVSVEREELLKAAGTSPLLVGLLPNLRQIITNSDAGVSPNTRGSSNSQTANVGGIIVENNGSNVVRFSVSGEENIGRRNTSEMEENIKYDLENAPKQINNSTVERFLGIEDAETCAKFLQDPNVKSVVINEFSDEQFSKFIKEDYNGERVKALFDQRGCDLLSESESLNDRLKTLFSNPRIKNILLNNSSFTDLLIKNVNKIDGVFDGFGGLNVYINSDRLFLNELCLNIKDGKINIEDILPKLNSQEKAYVNERVSNVESISEDATNIDKVSQVVDGIKNSINELSDLINSFENESDISNDIRSRIKNLAMELSHNQFNVEQYGELIARLAALSDIINSKTDIVSDDMKDVFNQTEKNISSLLSNLEAKVKMAASTNTNIDTTENKVLESDLAKQRFSESVDKTTQSDTVSKKTTRYYSFDLSQLNEIRGYDNIYNHIISKYGTKVDIKQMLESILFNGEYNGYYFSTNAAHHIDSPWLECQRRISIAYLAATNPETFDYIVKNDIKLFHGTNSEILPSIVENGFNSLKALYDLGLATPSTAESWSIVKDNPRNFISFTDVLPISIGYATYHVNGSAFPMMISPKYDAALKAGFTTVGSDVSEVGVKYRIPQDGIDAIFVPSENVEQARAMVASTDIKVFPFDLYNNEFGKVYFDEDSYGISTYFDDSYEFTKTDEAIADSILEEDYSESISNSSSQEADYDYLIDEIDRQLAELGKKKVELTGDNRLELSDTELEEFFDILSNESEPSNNERFTDLLTKGKESILNNLNNIADSLIDNLLLQMKALGLEVDLNSLSSESLINLSRHSSFTNIYSVKDILLNVSSRTDADAGRLLLNMNQDAFERIKYDLRQKAVDPVYARLFSSITDGDVAYELLKKIGDSQTSHVLRSSLGIDVISDILSTKTDYEIINLLLNELFLRNEIDTINNYYQNVSEDTIKNLYNSMINDFTYKSLDIFIHNMPANVALRFKEYMGNIIYMKMTTKQLIELYNSSNTEFLNYISNLQKHIFYQESGVKAPDGFYTNPENFVDILVNYNRSDGTKLSVSLRNIINGPNGNIYIYDINGRLFYSDSEIASSIYFNTSEAYKLINEFLSEERLQNLSDKGYLGTFEFDTNGNLKINMGNYINLYLTVDSYVNSYERFIDDVRDNNHSLQFGVDQKARAVNRGSNFVNARGVADIMNSGSYERFVNYFKTKYNMSEKTIIDTLLKVIDNKSGACSYANIANTIFLAFRNNSTAFKETFGFDMYEFENGKKTLNSRMLLMDLYIRTNSTDIGIVDGKNTPQIFSVDPNTNERIINSKIDEHGFLMPLNDNAQVYMSGGVGVYSAVYKYLADYGIKFESTNLNYINSKGELDIERLKSDIRRRLLNGELLSIGEYVDTIEVEENGKKVRKIKPDQRNLIFHNLDGGEDTEILNWREGGGHVTTIVGITEDSLIVVSWGQKHEIKFEDLTKDNCSFRSINMDIPALRNFAPDSFIYDFFSSMEVDELASVVTDDNFDLDLDYILKNYIDINVINELVKEVNSVDLLSKVRSARSVALILDAVKNNIGQNEYENLLGNLTLEQRLMLFNSNKINDYIKFDLISRITDQTELIRELTYINKNMSYEAAAKAIRLLTDNQVTELLSSKVLDVTDKIVIVKNLNMNPNNIKDYFQRTDILNLIVYAHDNYYSNRTDFINFLKSLSFDQLVEGSTHINDDLIIDALIEVSNRPNDLSVVIGWFDKARFYNYLNSKDENQLNYIYSKLNEDGQKLIADILEKGPDYDYDATLDLDETQDPNKQTTVPLTEQIVETPTASITLELPKEPANVETPTASITLELPKEPANIETPTASITLKLPEDQVTADVINIDRDFDSIWEDIKDLSGIELNNYLATLNRSERESFVFGLSPNQTEMLVDAGIDSQYLEISLGEDNDENINGLLQNNNPSQTELSNLRRAESFFSFDNKVKDILSKSATMSKAELMDAIEEIDSYLYRMVKGTPLESVLPKIDEKIKVINKALSNVTDTKSLDQFKKEYIYGLSREALDAIADNVVGYAFNSYSSALSSCNSLNEILHAIHHSALNATTYENGGYTPILFSGTQLIGIGTTATYNEKIKIYGINTELLQNIYEAINNKVVAGEMNVLSLDNKVLFMVRDSGHALTIEVTKLGNGKVEVSYQFPKITNVEKANKVKGIEKVNKNSVFGSGGFITTESEIGTELRELIESIPTDEDIEPFNWNDGSISQRDSVIQEGATNNTSKNIQTLKDSILSKITPEMSELEKARLIYMELGQKIDYSPLYRYATTTKNDVLYDSIYNGIKTMNDLETDNTIICASWVQIYSEMLKEVGFSEDQIIVQRLTTESEVKNNNYVFNSHAAMYVQLSNGDLIIPDMTVPFTGAADFYNIKVGNGATGFIYVTKEQMKLISEDWKNYPNNDIEYYSNIVTSQTLDEDVRNFIEASGSYFYGHVFSEKTMAKLRADKSNAFMNRRRQQNAFFNYLREKNESILNEADAKIQPLLSQSDFFYSEISEESKINRNLIDSNILSYIESIISLDVINQKTAKKLYSVLENFLGIDNISNRNMGTILSYLRDTANEEGIHYSKDKNGLSVKFTLDVKSENNSINMTFYKDGNQILSPFKIFVDESGKIRITNPTINSDINYYDFSSVMVDGKVDVEQGIKNGLFILSDKEKVGARNKFWFEYNGKDFMFKQIISDSFEDFSEVIANKLAQKLGLNSAYYAFATYNGKKGVITRSFLDENESFVPATEMLEVVYNKYIAPIIEFTKSIKKLMNGNLDIQEVIKLSVDERKQLLSSINEIFDLNDELLHSNLLLDESSISAMTSEEINEKLYDFCTFVSQISEIYDESFIERIWVTKKHASEKSNNLYDLMAVFDIYSKINDYNYSNSDEIFKQLIDMLIFDLLTNQADRHSANWGIVVNEKNKTIRLAPIFDNSNMFNLSNPNDVENIVSYVKNLESNKLPEAKRIRINKLLANVIEHSKALFRVNPENFAGLSNTEIVKDFIGISSSEFIDRFYEIMDNITIESLEQIFDEIKNENGIKIPEEIKIIINTIITNNVENIKIMLKGGE